MRMRIVTPLVLLLLVGCSSAGGVATPPPTPIPTSATTIPTPSASDRPLPELVPADGTAWFGMNLDWANDSVADVSARLGATPSVWVQFVVFPLDDAGRGNLDAFIDQVAAVDGIGLITLEPRDGLDSVTEADAEELARLLDGYWRASGTPSIVRFAHEMNGSWYPWGQQPEAYIDAFRTVATAVHALAPASAMAWAPNEGSGYPFSGGTFTSDDPSLDTNGDGEITNTDDPYAPYWPGDDAVDWVGMSVYHWGIEYPWGENELPTPEEFRSLLTGAVSGAHEGQVPIPDFYAAYAEGHDKPMGVFETAALFNPAADGPDEGDLKEAWWQQVTAPAIHDEFPRIAMLNWFEWRKDEPEVGGIVDWRLTSDPELARALIAEAADGWLRFGGLSGE